ncbi:DNA repair protein RecN [Spongiimicrobium salis]|uniref:DNA repair protein RecN n=1 Tax=Spongiimicrobium salis TaxID=1667022 RepID=UPI00374D52C6
MLASLSIKNYALIDQLNISFTDGFSIITGETGAGKSILLGGLSLVLGKRADLSSLRNKENKCIVEAEFAIGIYQLEVFFETHDLDYEAHTIIRREILPSGKSRAFVNDSPVNLSVLSQLGNRLIDVHSQHQTLRMTENDFQMKVVDALANHGKLLKEYRENVQTYHKLNSEVEALLEVQQNSLKEHDYNSFLLKELQAAPLQAGVQEELEEQYEQLNNVETILEQLSLGHGLISGEQMGVLSLLGELKQAFGKLSGYGNQYASLNDRIQSVFIEVDDIAGELQSLEEGIESNPALLETINTKLQLLYDLQKKHVVSTVEELMVIREELQEKVNTSENIEEEIQKKKAEHQVQEEILEKIAGRLSSGRKKVIPKLKKQLENSLATLGMPSATFAIEITPQEQYKGNGKDNLAFLFSANKGGGYDELKKVASGGELSRIMLTIKAILAQYEKLPTMMFDEIDTGVSGEISNRMGEIMEAMSGSMQIFAITHLPQVASKGKQHFKVYKEEVGGETHTRMKLLSQEERIVELAEMLGGKALSDSALAHARQLLN